MFLKNLNPIVKKTLIAFILAIICVTLILLIYYLGTPGKILGSIIFSFICIFAIFEFIKPFDIPTWTKFIIPCSGVFIMLIPFNTQFLNFINVDNDKLAAVGDNQPYKNILVELIGEQFKFSVGGVPGIGFPILAVMIFIPCLFTKNYRNIFSTFIVILIAVIIICFSIKFLFYFTILQFSLTLILLFGVILTDTMAYFGGRLLGNKIFKRKLAPNISPNKTIEGAIIGFIASSAFLFLIFGLEKAQITGGINFGKIGDVNRWTLLFVAPFAVPILSIIGDLLFSLVKRKLSIKDFSSLIPSHGGLLDRFDSTILVFFIFPLFIAFAQ